MPNQEHTVPCSYDENGVVVQDITVAELIELLRECRPDSPIDFYIVPPYSTPTASVGEFKCVVGEMHSDRIAFTVCMVEPDNINW